MREIRDKLNTEYIEFKRRGHFQSDDFPELIDRLMAALKKLNLDDEKK